MNNNMTSSKFAISLASAVGVISWALISFVPYFHNGIPIAVSSAIPGVVVLAAHFFGYNFAASRAPKMANVFRDGDSDVS